jgi:hypothetical protein
MARAFIALRRSRNTRGYYLVESYRDDDNRSRKRTLCYLGREQDGTDTLAKAFAHWERVRQACAEELRHAKPARKVVLRKRRDEAAKRLTLLAEHLKLQAEAEAARLRKEAEAEELNHWQTFERLRRAPNAEHAQAAKRAFLMLAKRHHPDQGGSHEAFLRLKEAYDRATASWRAYG